jgi:hypothetical protein
MVAANRMGTSKAHRSRSRASLAGSAVPQSLEDARRMARGVQRKLRREMQDRPELVLAAVAGASFVAGAAVGSKVGRILLSALVPFGLQHLLTTQAVPRVAAYVAEWLHTEQRTNGAATHAS